MVAVPAARVLGVLSRRLGLGLLLVPLACGARARESDDGPDWPGAGEANGGASAGATFAAGDGPNLTIPSAGGAAGQRSSVPEGTSCQFAPPSCAAHEQVIWINASPSVSTALSYPLDSSCGDCVDVACRGEDCPVELSCSLWASGRASCGSFTLSLAACSDLAGKGTCLNTANPQPYYVDPTGKRWNQVTLVGDATPLSYPLDGLVDLDLGLDIGDGVTTQRLSVHAHVCAQIVQTLQVCK